MYSIKINVSCDQNNDFIGALSSHFRCSIAYYTCWFTHPRSIQTNGFFKAPFECKFSIITFIITFICLNYHGDRVKIFVCFFIRICNNLSLFHKIFLNIINT